MSPSFPSFPSVSKSAVSKGDRRERRQRRDRMLRRAPSQPMEIRRQTSESPMKATRLLTTLGLLLLCVSTTRADDALSGLVQIEVLPREATLIGPRGVQHFIVTGVDERG